MKKLSCIFIFLVAAGLQTLSAQVPGYQGKRFSVGYNASSFFYFKDVSPDGGLSDLISAEIGSTTLSYKTELIANYTVSRKVTMGFSYYFAKQVDNFPKNYLDFGFNREEMIPKGGTAECKLNMFELHFQFFRKNFIAPVGLYHQFSIAVVNYGLANSDNQLTLYPKRNYSNYSGTIVVNGPSGGHYSCFKLGYAIGKTNPVGHHLYINTALGVNFFRGGDAAYVKSTITVKNYVQANLNKNLRTHNFLKIKIGLGWLAF